MTISLNRVSTSRYPIHCVRSYNLPVLQPRRILKLAKRIELLLLRVERFHLMASWIAGRKLCPIFSSRELTWDRSVGFLAGGPLSRKWIPTGFILRTGVARTTCIFRLSLRRIGEERILLVSDLETRNEPCERELAGRALLNRVTKSCARTHGRSSRAHTPPSRKGIRTLACIRVKSSCVSLINIYFQTKNK